MKNYTSTVDPERSIANIEELLVRTKALGINKTYADGVVTSITFCIFEPSSGKNIAIKLPANVPQVYEALKKRHKAGRLSASGYQRLQKQAKRTAWKLMQDWLEVQLSLIEMQQAELLQIFLPYIAAGNDRTYYEYLKEQKFIGLPAPSKKEESN